MNFDSKMNSDSKIIANANANTELLLSAIKIIEQPITFKTGTATNIGGGRENQDTVCCFQNADIIAICVIDGHGTDGKWIAEVCKTTTESWISENNERMLSEPVKSLSDLFVDMKQILSEKIVEKYSKLNQECKIESSGIILIKKIYTNKWQPLLSGGATMTVAVLIKKTLKLYMANIGDSDAILCSSNHILSQDDLTCENEFEDIRKTKENTSVSATKYLMLTADHSPNNPKEYMRMRDIAPSPYTPNKANINIIYDNQRITNKIMCCQVFNISNPIPTILTCPIDSGYHKNVRHEYATYLLNQENNLLAFTRSMGDFHMYPYGVVCVPTISSIDLSSILDRYEETDTQPTLCLLISTDGVWDNWLFEDVQHFMMYDDCLETVATKPDGVQIVLDSFMDRNNMLGISHFGNSSDNATSAVMYIKK